MANYYVNKNPQSTGEHEVHKEGCPYMPQSHNQEYLGNFSTCQEAVQKAAQKYRNVDGCKFCSPTCHHK